MIKLVSLYTEYKLVRYYSLSAKTLSYLASAETVLISCFFPRLPSVKNGFLSTLSS